MSAEANKAIVRRYFNEIMNEGKIATIEELTASNFVFMIPTIPEPVSGPEGFKGFVTTLRTAFPDLRFLIEKELAEGDKVAVRWTFSGTHKGDFLGVSPTGKQVTDAGIDIFHLADGKFTKIWVNEDSLGLLRQLGAIPAPKQEEGSPTSAEANKALVRRYFDEIMNQGNMATIDEVMASNFIFTIPTIPEPFYGPEGFKQLVTLLRTAFPDLYFTDEDEISEGDTIISRWKASGTHKGDFQGIPPSGKQFAIEGIGMYRIVDGKFVENRVNEDSLGLLQQIGGLPPQGSAQR